MIIQPIFILGYIFPSSQKIIFIRNKIGLLIDNEQSVVCLHFLPQNSRWKMERHIIFMRLSGQFVILCETDWRHNLKNIYPLQTLMIVPYPYKRVSIHSLKLENYLRIF